DPGFTAITSQRPGALVVLADPLAYTRRREIIATVARHRIPAVYAFREATDEGGLMSYGVNIPALYRRAAYFVDRLFKGAKPGANPAPGRDMREAFLQSLRDLGYVEGRNVVIEYRFAEGTLERYPALAAELVSLKVDVILAPITPAVLAAKQATRTIPIVFTA